MMAEKELNRKQIAKAIAEYFEPEYQPIVEILINEYANDEQLEKLIEAHKKFVKTDSDNYLEEIFNTVFDIGINYIVESASQYMLPSEWIDALVRENTVQDILNIVNFIKENNLEEEIEENPEIRFLLYRAFPEIYKKLYPEIEV